MMFVFVSSPYGDPDLNVSAQRTRIAAAMCKWVIDNTKGEIPLAPHIICSQWWTDEHDRVKAIEFCSHILPHCAKLYVLDVPPTHGMVEEINIAKRLGIPIEYISIDDLDPTLESDLGLCPTYGVTTHLAPIVRINNWRG